MSSTLSAGTRCALTHLFTACGYMPSALANARWPPLARTARSIEVSMRGISTRGMHMSTDGWQALSAPRSEHYCLPMIDIKLASDFGDLLDRMIDEGYLKISTAMEVLQCSRAMVDKYRKGSRPESEKLQRFADRFGYDYGDLLKLTHGKDTKGNEAEPQFRVHTERGAIVARMFENLPNAEARAAIYELLASLSKEPRKTSSEG